VKSSQQQELFSAAVRALLNVKSRDADNISKSRDADNIVKIRDAGNIGTGRFLEIGV
jgi:hypothetical protein